MTLQSNTGKRQKRAVPVEEVSGLAGGSFIVPNARDRLNTEHLVKFDFKIYNNYFFSLCPKYSFSSSHLVTPNIYGGLGYGGIYDL